MRGFEKHSSNDQSHSHTTIDFFDSLTCVLRYIDVERQAETTGQITPKEQEALRARLERIHTVTLSEIHHFHESLKKDLKAMMQVGAGLVEGIMTVDR